MDTGFQRIWPPIKNETNVTYSSCGQPEIRNKCRDRRRRRWIKGVTYTLRLHNITAHQATENVMRRKPTTGGTYNRLSANWRNWQKKEEIKLLCRCLTWYLIICFKCFFLALSYVYVKTGYIKHSRAPNRISNKILSLVSIIDLWNAHFVLEIKLLLIDLQEFYQLSRNCVADKQSNQWVRDYALLK